MIIVVFSTVNFTLLIDSSLFQKGSLDIRHCETMRFSTDSKRKFTLLKTF